jgi:hypothetical protein
MKTHIRYLLLVAFRDLLFSGLIIATILASLISASLGSTALVEKEAMTLVFASASVRILLMVGLIVFVSFSLRYAFEQKEIDVLVSRPLSRPQIILAYWAGYACVAAMLVLLALVILSFLPIQNATGFYAWGASLLLESWLVIAMTLFAAFTLPSGVISVLAVLAMVVLGRMMGFFLSTAAGSSAKVTSITEVNQAIDGLLEAVAIIVPRLDLFTQSDWPVYGLVRFEDFTLALTQAAIFIPLLLIATIIDFKRKEF